MGIPVSELLEAEGLELRLLAGESGLERPVESSRIVKAGIHLTGFFEHFHIERVQIFGRAESAYLADLDTPDRIAKLRAFFAQRPLAIVLAGNHTPADEIADFAQEFSVSVLQTPLDTASFISIAEKWLEEHLAPKTTVHGVLMDVFGVGVLMTGESGIGKSEVALDLILRDHRFVADDVVEVVRRPQGTLIGRGAEIIRHHIEIRGLGILNVKDLFGVAAIRDRKKIELIVELVAWEKMTQIERAGLDEQTHEILGVQIPYLQLPVSPGRNITSIVEVAARNHLLQMQGIHSAREFQEKLLQNLAARARSEEEVE